MTSVGPQPLAASSRRHRGTAVGVTLVIGAGLLAATLHVPRPSAWFTILGIALATTWFVGAILARPVPIRPRTARPWPTVVAFATAVGGVAFLVFWGGSRVARHVPIVSGAVDSVLDSTESPTGFVVLVVALVNGVAEEAFFRGAVYNAVGPGRTTARTTVLATAAYVAVTAATGNVALIVAAIVMGMVFGLERAITGSVLAPIVTHLTWTTLMLTVLPR